MTLTRLTAAKMQLTACFCSDSEGFLGTCRTPEACESHLWHSVYFCRAICHRSAWKSAKTLEACICFLQAAFPNKRLFAVVGDVLRGHDVGCRDTIGCNSMQRSFIQIWVKAFFFFFATSKKTTLCFLRFLCKQFPTLNQMHLSLRWVFIMIYPDWFPTNLHFWWFTFFHADSQGDYCCTPSLIMKQSPFNEGPLFFIWKLAAKFYFIFFCLSWLELWKHIWNMMDEMPEGIMEV